MAVPNIFGTATSAIPLSQLDTNFATPVTIGNTAVQLGNTVTSFGNVTLTNVTISSGNVTITGANVSGTANVSTLIITGNQTSLGNVSITGNVSANIATFGAGSNTAPAITTTGDTNTGIFFPAADTIAFAEGGVESARFNSSGVFTTTNDATIQGLTVGRGAGAVSTNTAVGASALAANTTGGFNTAVGTLALTTNTGAGEYNNAFGWQALKLNTTGNENQAFGISAMLSNTTGSNNTAMGSNALRSNTTASNNTAVGYQAGYTNSTGTNIVAFGQSALYTNNANDNTAVGRRAGFSNSSGIANAFFGTDAGYSTTSTGNSFFGSGSGNAVTSGAKNTIIGQYSGNQGGLDIRTLSNNVILSDGDGNPTNARYSAGAVSTTAVDIAPTNSATGGLHFVSGFNTADGSQAWFLIATRVNSVTTIASSNGTGLTITFGQTSSVRLNAVTSSGTINIICTTIS